MRTVAYFTLAFLLSGCASIQRWQRCNSKHAYQAGFDDAGDGRSEPEHLSDADVCTEDYKTSDYRGDYRRGYTDKKKDICHLDEMDRLALRDVERHDFTGIEGSVYRICGNDFMAQARPRFEKAFERHLCTENKFFELGSNHGEDIDGDTGVNYLTWCSTNKISLGDSYRRGYESGVEDTCDPGKQYQTGYESSESEFQSTLKFLRRCPVSLRGSVVQSFTNGYQEAERDRRHAELVRLEKEKLEESRRQHDEKMRARLKPESAE